MTQPMNPFAAAIARRAAQAAASVDDGPAVVTEVHAAPAIAAVPAGTPANAVAKVEPDAPAAGPSLHVVTSTGDSRFDAILAGTVGTLDEQGRFQLDPDYKQLSYLFTLAAGSMLPAVRPGQELSESKEGDLIMRQGERTIEVIMPAAATVALKANLIELSAVRWGAFYEQQLGGLTPGSLNANMLKSERDNVAGAVDRYLAGLNMQQWDVPVIYSTTVHEEGPAERASDEAGLLKMAGSISRMTPDVTRQPIAHVAAPSAPAVDGAGAEAGAPVSAVPAEWAAHQGALNLTVEGSLTVRAGCAEDAARLTSALLLIANAAPRLAGSFAPRAESIQAAELLPPMTEGDDDGYGDDDYDRDR